MQIVKQFSKLVQITLLTYARHNYYYYYNVHNLDGFTNTLDQSTDTAVPMADNKHRLSLWIHHDN